MRYLTRRAASKLQLRRYLRRKLDALRTEDGDDFDREAAIDAVLARLEELQLVDDPRLAQSRAHTLAGKGLSARRMRTHLKHQGFDVADPALAPAMAVEDEAQALRYAERKRLGPFAARPERTSLEKDVRALVRAGFSPGLALRLMKDLRSSLPQPEHDDAAEVNDT